MPTSASVPSPSATYRPASPQEAASLVAQAVNGSGAFRSASQQGRMVLAIDGLTGSGKTSLARAVRQQLGLPAEAVLALEDMVPGWDALAQGVDRAASVLRNLAQQGTASAPQWDWVRMQPGTDREVILEPGQTLILEGCGALAAVAQDLPGLQVLRVRLQAPADVRHARLAARDPYTWDVGAWERQERTVMTRWAEDLRWQPQLVLLSGSPLSRA